jgi:hypothetical protein
MLLEATLDSMMSNHPDLENYLSDRLRIKVGIHIPDLMADADYDLWARSLLERDGWSTGQELAGLDSPSGDERLFLQSFLQTIRLFM